MASIPYGDDCIPAEKGLLPEQAEKFTMIPSAGVTAVVNGKTVRAGNLKLLEDMTISRTLAAAA